jgi:hypothetical protein
MRWYAVIAALAVAVSFYALWPASDSQQLSSASKAAPSAPAAPVVPIDLLAALTEFQKTLKGPKFSVKTCASVLEETYKKIYDLRPTSLDSEKTKSQAATIFKNLFETKLLLRSRLKEFALPKEEACVSAARDIFRAGRVLEDALGEFALEYPDDDPAQRPTAFTGGELSMLVNPQTGPFELKSGDILLSRGSAFVSAAIARLADVDSNFSHLEILYIDAEGKKWTIGSHIEVGAIAQPFETYAADGKMRALVFRQSDSALAHKAAELLFKKVKAHQESTGENLPYDFAMDVSDSKEFFCSELVAHAYAEASEQKLRLPQYLSRVRMKNRNFLDRLGIKAERTFVPADIELDPRFELVAEWRDFSRVNASHMQDAVLTAMYKWMDEENYILIENASVGIKSFLAWHLRRWPVFSNLLKEKLPKNMGQNVIGAMTVLNETGEVLFRHLEEVNDTHFETSDFWLTPQEMLAALDRFRKEDLKKYQIYQKTRSYDPLVKRPDFHLLFRRD